MTTLVSRWSLLTAMTLLVCSPLAWGQSTPREPVAHAQSAAAATSATMAEALLSPPLYREVTILPGTTLPLALTSSVATDTNVVADGVTAELTRAIDIDGREVLPAGARLTGIVTVAGGTARVNGRAMIAFRFTALYSAGNRYALHVEPFSRLSSARTGRGEVRLASGANVTTWLTAPLTVLVRTTEREAIVMDVRPLHDRIIVRRVEEGEQTHGSIIIPDTAKEKPQRGTVIAVGAGKVNEDGTRVPLDVKAGDAILFGKYTSQEVKLDGVDYLIMREDEVLAVVGNGVTRPRT